MSTLGQRSPVSPVAVFAEPIIDLSARVAALERLLGSPGVQSGSATTTTDGSGDISVTFPAPFAATPVIIVQRISTGTTQLAVHVTARSTTGFTARFTSNDAVQASVADVAFMWLATS